jgi:hypothetical protein
MILYADVSFGDKKMKGCMECGKKLGVVGGYRHPTMGKNYLLCSTCFDTVFASVERYREFVSPYVGFFNKESSTREDIQEIEKKMVHGIKIIQTIGRNLSYYDTNQYDNDNAPKGYRHPIDPSHV